MPTSSTMSTSSTIPTSSISSNSSGIYGTNVSCIGATVRCIPLIGALTSLADQCFPINYNRYNASSQANIKSLDGTRIKQIKTEIDAKLPSTSAPLTGEDRQKLGELNVERIEIATGLQNSQKKLDSDMIASLKGQTLKAKLSVVRSVLTLATLVSLVAFGIIIGSPLIPILAFGALIPIAMWGVSRVKGVEKLWMPLIQANSKQVLNSTNAWLRDSLIVENKLQ